MQWPIKLCQLSGQNSTRESLKTALHSLATNVIFHVHQAIASRGHRDDWSMIGDNPTNSCSGSFLSLLQFHIHAADCIFK